MAQQPLSSATQPTDIYGGDEVSALVLDPGYCYTRAGFAGEDVPKVVIPSFYAHLPASDDGNRPARNLFGDDVLFPRTGLEIRNYMSNESIVEDWDAAIPLWEHALVSRLQPIPSRLVSPPETDKVKAKSPAAPAAARDADAMDIDAGATANGDSAGDGNGDAASASAEAVEDLDKPLAENPLLMTEAPWNSGKARERAIEVAMESWGTPAFWLSRTPVLAAFAAGKASALVVDVGGAGTTVAAVHDGLVLRRSVQRSPAGGLYLSGQIRAMWRAGGSGEGAGTPYTAISEIVPTFMVENKTPVDAGAPAQARLRAFPFTVAPSFRAYEEERLLTEFKESVVEVWRGPGRFTAPGNEEFARTQAGRVFEMPDGSNQMWREQRFRVAEGLWDEQAAYGATAAAATNSKESSSNSGKEDGDEAPLTKSQTIPELVRAAINSVDVDLRPLLLGNVVVTGSTTLLNGFNDRLNNELTALWPGVRIKIHSAGLTSERRFGAWIGGSILASLGTFHQMWISRAEYDENGAAIVEKRCK